MADSLRYSEAHVQLTVAQLKLVPFLLRQFAKCPVHRALVRAVDSFDGGSQCVQSLLGLSSSPQGQISRLLFSGSLKPGESVLVSIFFFISSRITKRTGAGILKSAPSIIAFNEIAKCFKI